MTSSPRVEIIAKLVIDLGKILFGAAVVGFFIPGFSGAVTPLTFISGALLSGLLFSIGVMLTK